jgi:hypothetical protein
MKNTKTQLRKPDPNRSHWQHASVTKLYDDEGTSQFWDKPVNGNSSVGGKNMVLYPPEVLMHTQLWAH